MSREQITVEDQFRKTFSEESLMEMEQSLQQLGLLQPIVVCAMQSGSGYLLISGERRLRAIERLAKKGKRIPIRAILRDQNDRFLVQIHENEQREDLSTLERAASYRWLMYNDGATGEPREKPLSERDLADLLGKGRDQVHFLVRLAELPGPVAQLVSDDVIQSPRTLDAIGRFWRLECEELGQAICDQLSNGVRIQRDAITRLSQIAQQDSGPVAELTEMVSTGQLRKTDVVDALGALIEKSDNAGALCADILAEHEKGIPLERAIKDASGINTRTGHKRRVTDLFARRKIVDGEGREGLVERLVVRWSDGQSESFEPTELDNLSVEQER